MAQRHTVTSTEIGMIRIYLKPSVKVGTRHRAFWSGKALYRELVARGDQALCVLKQLALDLQIEPAFRPIGDAVEPFAHSRKRRIPIRDGQIGQVDIDREPRQIPDEQVDRGTAFQGKIGLDRDLGHRAGRRKRGTAAWP